LSGARDEMGLESLIGIEFDAAVVLDSPSQFPQTL
jgi:hypothetical protein